MHTLGQLGIIFAFGLAGEALARLTEVGVPASMWGLLLLLAALRSGLIRLESIAVAGGFLAANMAFFFIPSGAGILDVVEELRPVLFRLLLVCVATTALTFLATYYTVRCVRRLIRREE